MPQQVLNQCEEKMLKAVESMRKDFSTIRTGKANPSVLNNVTVDYYGSPMPINQLASVSASDPRTIVVKPYDKSILKAMEKAILCADLGFNPINDGDVIRIPVPALTEQTRKELVKQVKKITEDKKVAVRNIRRDGMEQFKKMVKNSEITEDELKKNSDKLQKLTDKYTEEIDKVSAEKEKDIMSI